MEQHYAAHISALRQRHDQALTACGYDHAVVYAGAPRLRFLDDSELPFTANPHFKAWLPLLAHPHSLLLLQPGERPRLVCYQPEDYWHVPPAPPSGYWVEHFDIDIVAAPEASRAQLPVAGRGAFIGEPGGAFAQDQPGELNPQKLLDRLHLGRTVKTDYEIGCMQEASRLGVEGHLAAERAFRAGGAELDIHHAYLAAVGGTDHSLPYESIVGLNEHGATLHYQGRDRQPPAQRHSLLIDAGASHNGYASDITRTYAEGPGDFADLIGAMDALQLGLCASIRAGTDYPSLHIEAHARIAGLLKDSGIVALEPDAVLAEGISSVFFPHGLGHFIGLQVHDVAGFLRDDSGAEIPCPEGHPFLRLTRRLEAGNVVTVEPGIYFIESLLGPLRASPAGKHVNWPLVERLQPCGGIRIEDDVVVQAGGCRNLTREAFAA